MDTPPHNAMGQIRLVLERRAGWDFASLGTASVEQAVRKRMPASGCETADIYLAQVVRDPEELLNLVEELAVPETWFFRDRLAYDCLRDALKDRCSRAGTGCRILSVPCSTGEEVYSIAAILHDHGLEPSQFQILGMDLSPRAIATAREGLYGAPSFRETDAAWPTSRSRWCQPQGDVWRIGDQLRRGIEFRVGNLADPAFLSGESPFDVIFCRNLLIYFHAEARRAAMGHLRRLLKPHGVLIVASAEARIAETFGLLRLGSLWPFAFHGPERHGESLPLTANATPRQPPRGFMASRPQNPLRAGRARTRSAGPVHRGRGSGKGAEVMPARAEVSSREPCESNLLRAAFQAADQGRLVEADAACSQVLTGNPLSVEALFLRGVLHQAQGACVEAQQCFDRVLYLDPRHYPALVHMVALAEQRGQWQSAENYRRRAREIDQSETP